MRYTTVLATILLLASLSLLGPKDTNAFKLETHVWIGQQVLNDAVPDGLVTIPPFGEFIVRGDIHDALTRFPRAYLMGTIGPDGFPDLVGGQVTVHPGLPGSDGWATDQWLRHVLAQAQGWESTAFAYGYLTHAASDVFAHSYVNTYTGDIFNLSDEQENELRHIALEEYIKNHMPPILDFGGRLLQPYDIVAAPVGFVRGTVLLNPHAAAQYRQEATSRYLAVMWDFYNALGDAVAKVEALRNEFEERIAVLNSTIASAQSQLNAFISDLNDLPLPDYPEICIGSFFDPTGFIASTCAAVAVTQATLARARASLALPQALFDITVASVLIPLERWRVEVQDAADQYIVTSQNVVIEIMKGGDPKAAIDKWLCESAPAFVAVPGVVTKPSCRANQAVTDFVTGISELEEAINSKLGDLAWLVNPIGKVHDIASTAIKEELKELGVNLVVELTGPNSVMSSLIRMRTTEMDSDGLNAEFGADSSDKGLLEIPDIAARVDAEMHLVDGKLTPETFNPIHNAIILSKLLLLTPAELNRMVTAAGIGSTIYGPTLYADEAGFNILLNAVRSIDGNHQWQEFGIPSPRREGFVDKKTKEERQYGYPFAEGGFRLWQDCEVRKKVFKEIFNGPLAVGIEAPSLLVGNEFSEILVDGDPNRASKDNPFPLSPDSQLEQKFPGDVDNDCEVDSDDLNIVQANRNLPASECPACDLDGDGQITDEDTRILSTLCTTPCAIAISIDIKPTGLPNSINPKNKGNIPVAILSSPDFDALARVDMASLTFGRTGDEMSLRSCAKNGEDVNNDGLADRVCHFYTQATGFQAGDTEGVVQGKTVEGTPIRGTDAVRVVP